MLLGRMLGKKAASLGAAFLPIFADDGAGLTSALASHSAEPTIALVVKNKIQKQ